MMIQKFQEIQDKQIENMRDEFYGTEITLNKYHEMYGTNEDENTIELKKMLRFFERTIAFMDEYKN